MSQISEFVLLLAELSCNDDSLLNPILAFGTSSNIAFVKVSCRQSGREAHYLCALHTIHPEQDAADTNLLSSPQYQVLVSALQSTTVTCNVNCANLPYAVTP